MAKFVLALLFILAGVVSGLNVYYIATEKSDNPLKYTVPQTLISVGPLREGDPLITRGMKCNSSGEPVSIRGQGSFYIRLDAHGVVPGAQTGNVLVLAAHECLDRTFTRALPALEAGIWRLQGFDCVLPEERHCRAWFSENFEVAQ